MSEPSVEDESDNSSTARIQALPRKPILAPSSNRPRPLRILTRADLATLPDPEWLIEGVVQAERFFCLYGEPSVGKTFVMLDFALCIATGTAWQRRAVRSGPVVYFSPEGTTGLKLRIEAWEMTHGKRVSDFFVVPDGPQLLKPFDRERIVDAIRSLPQPPAFAVVDTLARHTVGSKENAQEDMSIAAESFEPVRKEFRCTIGFVHHTAKGSDELRGSTVLLGAIDTAIFVKATDKNGAIELRCKKQKDADEFPDIPLQLAQVPLPRPNGPTSSCVVAAGVRRRDVVDFKNQLVHAPSSTSKHEQYQEAILRAFISIVGPTSEAALSPAQIQKETRMPQPSFTRAARDLVVRQLLTKEGHGLYKLTDEGRIAVAALP